MKSRNGTTQDKAHWDNILGQYENTVTKLPDRLKQELRQAHYGGDAEMYDKLKDLCLRVAEEIHHRRHMLGNVARS